MVEIGLTPGAALTGRVRTPAGAPIEGAKVDAFVDAGDGLRVQHAGLVADARGGRERGPAIARAHYPGADR